jgi:hypothetical protein
MCRQTLTRRAAIAACGAFVVVTATPAGSALAQSRVAVSAIRVDVAPLRANAGDPTAAWVEQELPRELAEALSGRLAPKGAPLTVRIDSLTIGRTRTAELGTTTVAPRRSEALSGRASHVEILGFGDRCGNDRAIQSCPCFGGGAGARVLDCSRSLIRPVRSRFAPKPSNHSAARAGSHFRSSRSGSGCPFGVRALTLALFDPESQCASRSR